MEALQEYKGLSCPGDLGSLSLRKDASRQREVTMCSCASSIDLTRCFDDKASVSKLSLKKEAMHEAEKHRWIEGVKAGRDLGERAIWDWFQRHWAGFLRAKWLEHLEGVNFWVELKPEDFGLLSTQFQDSPLLREIVSQLKAKGENLSILLWAQANPAERPMAEVMRILESLDINSARIEREVAHRLISQSQ